MKKRNTHKMKQSWDDIIFSGACNLLLIVFVLVVFYPLWFVVMASVSDPAYVNRGDFLVYPKGFNLMGYEEVFRTESIWIGYGNTILYTVCGTILGTAVTVLAGYALSRKDLPGRGLLMKIFVFTMYLSGGMIPFYLVVKSLGMVNNRMTLIILGSVSAYNMIVVRSFMESNIPDELMDAATIDGCGNGRFFSTIVVPLSKAVIAVIVLYIAVSHWNSYFNAMIFMTDTNKYPLQLYLRELLLTSSSLGDDMSQYMDPEALEAMQSLVEVLKYAVIVVATAPIICVYPFIQKYFVKGVMIGSVKG